MASNVSFPVDTAAVSWSDSNGTNLHVFSSDGYTVTQRSFTGSWTTGPLSVPGGAVSATAWTDSAGAHIRVYCTFEDATTEWCLDPGGSWYQGGYTIS